MKGLKVGTLFVGNFFIIHGHKYAALFGLELVIKDCVPIAHFLQAC